MSATALHTTLAQHDSLRLHTNGAVAVCLRVATGPNNLFYPLMDDDALHDGSYDYAFWMETDAFPVQSGWLDRLLEESQSPRGFWRKGPTQRPLHTLRHTAQVPRARFRGGVLASACVDRCIRVWDFAGWEPAKSDEDDEAAAAD